METLTKEDLRKLNRLGWSLVGSRNVGGEMKFAIMNGDLYRTRTYSEIQDMIRSVS